MLLISSITPSIIGHQNQLELKEDGKIEAEKHELALITSYTYGLPVNHISKEISIPKKDAELLFDKVKELQLEIAADPSSDKTQQVQNELLILADQHNLLPEGTTLEMLQEQIPPNTPSSNNPITAQPVTPINRASKFFCNFASAGSGSALPVIMFPRLIPIICTPIPRVFMRWSAYEGVTTCGGMLSRTGFIAYGQQQGFALGFWGIGFSIFLPPFMQYALFGYALFASVNAENFELWPPNYPPEISAISPIDGAENVPISTSELRFNIRDFNQDKMNYSVTTDPPIGYGTGENKPDGTYAIPISGLEGTEDYTWHVQVSDGENTVDATFTFSTEPVAPIISNPTPDDNSKYISVNLTELSFKLKDLQGDLMDYTVETSPDIGSASGSAVNDGKYTVPINNLDYTTDYTWYVNVTDGAHEKHKTYSFQTEPKMIFDPFSEGWQYRKQLTINHTKVSDDLVNFPVVLSFTDSDLQEEAQTDGDDILFMDDDGVANRLFHEIESYDESTGKLVTWVKVNTLHSTQGTNFYMYYGNPTSPPQEHPEVVWDSGYEAVWHMNDHTTSTIKDSTANGHIGHKKEVNSPMEITQGKIGPAQDFESSNMENIIIYDGIYECAANEDLTLEYWIKMETLQGKGLSCDNDDWGYYQMSTHNQQHSFVMNLFSMHPYKTVYPESTTTAQTDIWYYLVGTLDRSKVSASIYVNGIEEGRLSASGLNELDGFHHLRIGSSYHNVEDVYTDGIIDEIRISNTARNPQWVQTCYHNQNNPKSFWIIGPEETS